MVRNRARADAMGVARSGSALLAGLDVCARCGCRLNVHYDDGVPGFTPMNVWSAGRTTANRSANTWLAHAWTPSSESRVLLGNHSETENNFRG